MAEFTESDLNTIGVRASQVDMGGLAITLISTGAQLFMVLCGLSAFLESTKEARRGRLPYIALSFIVVAFSLVISYTHAARVYNLLFLSGGTGIGYQEGSWGPVGQSWETICSTVLIIVSMTLVDAMLLFRCYMVYANMRWVCILPAVTYIATIVFGFLSFALNLKAGSEPTRIAYDMAAAWVTTTIAFNVLVTLLILGRVIYKNRIISKVLPGDRDSGSRSVYTSVYAMLIESAAPTAITGLLFVGHQWAPYPSQLSVDYVLGRDTFAIISASLYYEMAVLGPLLLIFRVTLGKSWTSVAQYQAGGMKEDHQTALETLRFARSNATETRDDGV